MARPRRKSSGLTGDPRGDTGAPAVSTLEPMPVIASPPLSPRPSSRSVPRASKRKKVRSYWRRWKSISFKHTWLNPLIVMAIILSLYAIYPYESNPLHRALFLSYPLPKGDPLIPDFARNDPDAPVYYGKGPADISFVSFYVVVLSFTREFIMQRFLHPLAVRCGLKSRAKRFRFMEQMYTAVYFIIQGPVGFYVMSRTPVWYFNTDGMYEGFPHRSHEAVFKAYYLLQASYWAQQAIVLLLQLEKPRKDFKELVGHHIITLALIALSYRFHFTYMGVAVYITHDISDFFLATAKTLNYIDASITVPYFTFFTGVWIYLRHWINLRILYSILTTFATVGPFELNWETQQYKCWISQYITFALLACLQAINLFWLALILRIAVNAIMKYEEAKDTRSDDEESDNEVDEEDKKKDKAKPVMGVNGSANGRPKSPFRAAIGTGFSSGLEGSGAMNGCAIDSAPNTPTANGMINGGAEAPVGEGLKKR